VRMEVLLTVAPDSCDLSASCSGCFNLGDRSPATHSMGGGGCVVTRPGVDTLCK
jgi:hypothetical protein